MSNLSLSSFLRQARRRHVFRVAGLYVVGAWVVLQVADLLFETWGISPSALRHVWIAAALGLPISLVLAWRYDIVGGRVVRVEHSDAGENLSITGIDYAILAAVAAVAVLIVYTMAIDVSDTPEPKSATVDAQAVTANTVAVLPFVNMSGDPENEYFSDGLSDTLLHMLAQDPDLRVSARTSSFAFKDKNQDIREIADALGVAHVLEGSVQREDNRARITVQLVRASDGFHVWSKIYDRTIDDIFAIQDEIAQLVSANLTNSLVAQGGATEIEGLGTTSVAAYDLYLKAVSEQSKGSYSALHAAEAFLKEALAIDAEFYDAKIQLAINYYLQIRTGMRERGPARAEMIALLEQVVESQPDNVPANAWLMVTRAQVKWWAGEQVDQIELIERMRGYVNQAPSEIYFKLALAQMLLQTGQDTDESLQIMQDILDLDPLNPRVYYDIGNTYLRLNKFDDAKAALERSLELEPNQPLALDTLSVVALSTGDAVTHVRLGIQAFKIDPQDPELPGGRAALLYSLGLREQGEKFHADVTNIAPTSRDARELEMYEAVRFGSRELQNEVARKMIEDEVAVRYGTWRYFALFNKAQIDGSEMEALSYMESTFPGFLNFELPVEISLTEARFLALGALSQLESAEQIQERIELLGFELPLFISYGGAGASAIRMQTFALQGDTESAVQVALNEIFSQPAVANYDFDLILEQPVLAEVAADPRVQEALGQYQAEKLEAAREVAAYLAGLDSY